MTGQKHHAQSDDLATPHHLCLTCAKFVAGARDFLLLHDSDGKADVFADPYVARFASSIDDILSETEADLQTKDGNRACHLCAILHSALDESKIQRLRLRAHAFPSFLSSGSSDSDVEATEDEQKAIWARLVPTSNPAYTQGAAAAWTLRLYCGSRDAAESDRLGGEILKKSGVGFRCVRNEFVLGCEFCEACLDLGRHDDEREGWERRVGGVGRDDSVERSCAGGRYRWIRNTGSETCMEMIRGWMRECDAGHEICSAASDDDKSESSLPWRPTRLLHLEASSSSPSSIEAGIRLVPGAHSLSTADGEAAKSYATLSYRWPKSSSTSTPLVLSCTNLEQFSLGIAFADLPVTFQEVIGLCRRLGFAYIWIDALCIIQGQDGDWETEASRMGDVYLNSGLTIAVAVPTDQDMEDSQDIGAEADGVTRRRSPLRQHDCRVLRDETHTVFAKAGPENYFCFRREAEPGETELDGRGWVLQERVLSRRSVYFGRDGVHWECRLGVACETRPFVAVGKDHLHRGFNIKSVHRHLLSLGNVKSDEQKKLSCWSNMIEAYSRTTLTFDEDKLVAIAGLASLFRERSKEEDDAAFNLVSFGLWLRSFAINLHWRVFEHRQGALMQKVRRHSFAPTWSWASLSNVSIYNEHIVNAPDYPGHHQMMVSVVALPEPTAFAPANSLDAIIKGRSGAGGRVRLRGMMRRVEVAMQTREENFSLVGLESSHSASLGQRNEQQRKGQRNSEKAAPTVSTLFCRDEPLPKSYYHSLSLHCILTARFVADKNTEGLTPTQQMANRLDLGLVLSSSGNEQSGQVNVYQRVGLFREKSDSDTDEGQMFAEHHPEVEFDLI